MCILCVKPPLLRSMWGILSDDPVEQATAYGYAGA